MNELIAVLPYAAPLGYAVLGELIGQKSGVINIGLEGMMLLAAFLTLIGATLAPGMNGLLLGLLLAMLGATALALVSGWFTVRLGADQVVVGTAINLFALGLTGTLFRAKYGHSGQLLSIPKLPAFLGLDPLLWLLFLLIPGVWLVLNRTGWGLAVRSAGEYEKASQAAGFSVVRLRLGALAVGGCFAGLAGAYLVVGTTGTFVENMTSGRGFVAIALVTFGRWNPFWVCAATLLIGWLDTLQFRLQAAGSFIPYQFLIAMPYLVALIVLVIAGKGTAAPGALGKPLRRE